MKWSNAPCALEAECLLELNVHIRKLRGCSERRQLRGKLNVGFSPCSWE